MRPSQFLSALDDALKSETFVMLVLSQPRRSNASSKVTVRPVELKTGLHFQWAERIGAQEKHRNLSGAELIEATRDIFPNGFGDAHLFTELVDVTARTKGGSVQIRRKPPTKKSVATAHNREKQYIIPVGEPCAFLAEIGVMTPIGDVRPAMYHKFRQINRYLEFLQDVLPSLPQDGTLKIVDFGCGKSYLTFAMHHFLTKIHNREVEIVGLDRKSDVLVHCQGIAKRLECHGLRFAEGDIATFRPQGEVHLAVSLHACDTATDDAIAAALSWGCQVIMAVPCCQHELNATLDRGVLPGLTEYGLLKERFAAQATDALRAQFLEVHGYRTQIVEFIDLEHTPKNLLIRAIRRAESHPADVDSRREIYEQLKSQLRLETWHLEQAWQKLQPAAK